MSDVKNDYNSHHMVRPDVVVVYDHEIDISGPIIANIF